LLLEPLRDHCLTGAAYEGPRSAVVSTMGGWEECPLPPLSLPPLSLPPFLRSSSLFPPFFFPPLLPTTASPLWLKRPGSTAFSMSPGVRTLLLCTPRAPSASCTGLPSVSHSLTSLVSRMLLLLMSRCRTIGRCECRNTSPFVTCRVWLW
jgi:hypothetical protein